MNYFQRLMFSNRSINNSFELPAGISNSNSERGLFGSMALKLLNVFAKKAIPGVLAK
jgi:hypothetical protein